MIQRALPERGASLEKIQKQFEAWRKNRQCRGPIPEVLWDAAINLSENYSIGQISRTLQLNYRELKRRVQAWDTDRSVHFVEVKMREPDNVECTVEMEDKKGAKMKMNIKGGVDVEGLARIFWEKNR